MNKKESNRTILSKFFIRIVLLPIKFYRLVISPMLPPSCRYTPTCSEYAMHAIEKYGVFKGCFFSIKRILRCNPFSKGGYDPVK